MVLSDVSIKRPVLATVLSLVLIIFGFFAYESLTVREYPDIDPPILSVSTTYEGSSAQIIESQVTQVIEDAVAGIEGIKSVKSRSREDSSGVTIEFNLARDIEAAANDVRDRVARYIRRLPDEADAPRIAKSDTDARPIMWLSLTSDRMKSLDLTDYAERFLVDRLSIVPGVASVRIGGSRRYAMRIWLDRRSLAARGLTVQDVEDAIRSQNVELPSGRIESQQREFSVRTEAGLTSAEEFRNIVVREVDDYLVRLGDVARVEIAAENDRTAVLANGRNAVGLGIIRQSKSNTLEVANGVKAEVANLSQSLPQGMALDVSYDQSVFIAESIKEVFIALAISMSLVVAVIFLFLRTLRATLIPAVAIPVSIIASFTVLAALGYSINVLTLLALVLAIGLVVDDAIVVLENIHRRIENGEPPLLAALRGARQIGFAVIATTVVLVAVFLPISFLQGDTGRLFREFGVAVAAAVMFSSFVALSLTPMMCSKLLRPAKDEGPIFRATEIGFNGLNRGYKALLGRTLRAPVLIIAAAIAISLVSYGIKETIPTELAPAEDQGVFFVAINGPEGTSLDYTRKYVDDIEEHLMQLREDGIAERVITILAPSWGSASGVNFAFVIVRLKDWDEREQSQDEVLNDIRPAIMAIPGVRAFPYGRKSIGRSRFGPDIQMVVGGPSYDVIDGWTEKIVERVKRDNPRLRNVQTNYDETRPQIEVRIDRDRAGDLGVSVQEIGRTLETMLGIRYATTFNRGGKQYNVILRARADDRATPNDLSNLYVRSQTSGRLIPLSNLVSFKETGGARLLNRVDRLRTITVSARLTKGYTIGEAVAYMENIAAEELPAEARVTFSGASQEFKESSAALYFTFGMALLVVFLALAAQFESFIHPLIILISVPLAVTGALASMLFTGLSLNVYSQIGLIMLIGLTAKNAILIVEFANQLRDEGRDIFTAVLDAAAIRLRPILMTTISTALGALPLALATGAGAEARSALGIVIIGGVLFSTLLSLFVVPVFYLLLARFTKPTGFIARRLSELESRHDKRRAAAPAE